MCAVFFPYIFFIRSAVDVPSFFVLVFVATNARCQCVSYVAFWFWTPVCGCVCVSRISILVFAVRVAGCRSALWFRFFADCDFNSKRFNVFIVACAKSCHSFNSFGCFFVAAFLFLIRSMLCCFCYISMFCLWFTCCSARISHVWVHDAISISAAWCALWHGRNNACRVRTQTV